MPMKTIFFNLVMYAGFIFAQEGFTFSPVLTSAHLDVGRTLIIDAPIVNISDDTLYAAVLRTENTLPVGWSSALCLGGTCFPSDWDSVMTTDDFYQLPILPGEERAFSLDVFANGAEAVDGTANISLHVMSLETPGDFVAVDFVVSSLSSPPLPDAGEDQSVNEGVIVYLDGSFSDDPDGDNLIFLWESSQAIVFDDPASDAPTFMAPFVDEEMEILCILTVSDGIFSVSDTVSIFVENTISIHSSEVANKFRLGSPYPNPFNPSTTISYELPRESFVTIVITNIYGQEIWTTGGDVQPKGRYSIQWTGRNDLGEMMGSGVYFCIIQFDAMTESRKLVLVK